MTVLPVNVCTIPLPLKKVSDELLTNCLLVSINI